MQPGLQRRDIAGVWLVFCPQQNATNGSAFVGLQKQPTTRLPQWKTGSAAQKLMVNGKDFKGFVVGTFKAHRTGSGGGFLCCKIR